MERKRNLVVGGTLLTLLAALGGVQAVLERAAAEQAGGVQAPRFEVDPFWPKPLPNHWVLGQTIGVWVDDQDVVWIINRGSATLAANEKALELKTGECCAGAPPVIAYDAAGNLVRHWGGPGAGYDWPASNHGIFVDHVGHVWIGGNGAGDSHIVRFTKDGKFVAQYGKPEARRGQARREGTTDVCARQQRPGELRTSGEDLRRSEGERGVRRRRILQHARRGARRQDRRDQTVLGRLRQQAG